MKPKTRRISVLAGGLLLRPSVSFAQDDFSRRWEMPGSTPISEVAVSPFASAAPPVVITQTADVISWQTADARPQTIAASEPLHRRTRRTLEPASAKASARQAPPNPYLSFGHPVPFVPGPSTD